ncbi:FAD:protein FMN transferase [bacterium]|nr:MAG: FAD:protein FMN transferase [bacterium]
MKEENSGITKSSATFFYAAITIFVMVLLAYSMFFRKNADSVTYRKDLMGTVVELTLFEGDRLRFDLAAERAFEEIKRLQEIFSSYSPDSEAAKITKAAGQGAVNVSPEMLELMTASLKVSALSNGAFDPTIGALGILWGYSGESGNVPEKGALTKALKLVNYRLVETDTKNSTVALKNTGMVLNLGGIAKGFVVGKTAEVLKANGVERAIVKAGGDMAFVQTVPEQKSFIIGIQDPRVKGKLIGEAHVTGGAISTSGDYERFFVKDGKRFNHILDPKTGMPALRTRSATVIADDGAVADGLSTAFFVLGADDGVLLAEKIGVEAIIMDSRGRVKTTKGFKGKIY